MYFMIKKACLEIVKELKRGGVNDQNSLNALKVRVSKKYGLNEILTNIKILCYLDKKSVERFKNIFI